MKECITHHHACDCREAEFAGWKERAEKAEAAHVRLVEAMKEVQDELSACNESPGGCGYWREAAKCRAGERDALKVRAERAEAERNQHHDARNAAEVECHRLRVEKARAEALLREACGYGYIIQAPLMGTWLTKVRDLLDGKHDKG